MKFIITARVEDAVRDIVVLDPKRIEINLPDHTLTVRTLDGTRHFIHLDGTEVFTIEHTEVPHVIPDHC